MGASSSFSETRAEGQRLLASVFARLGQTLHHSFDLIEELITHHFFRSLGDVDWSTYQLGPLVVSSLLVWALLSPSLWRISSARLPPRV